MPSLLKFTCQRHLRCCHQQGSQPSLSSSHHQSCRLARYSSLSRPTKGTPGACVYLLRYQFCRSRRIQHLSRHSECPSGPSQNTHQLVPCFKIPCLSRLHHVPRLHHDNPRDLSWSATSLIHSSASPLRCKTLATIGRKWSLCFEARDATSISMSHKFCIDLLASSIDDVCMALRS
jgi:hypothetical protein